MNRIRFEDIFIAGLRSPVKVAESMFRLELFIRHLSVHLLGGFTVEEVDHAMILTEPSLPNVYESEAAKSFEPVHF